MARITEFKPRDKIRRSGPSKNGDSSYGGDAVLILLAITATSIRYQHAPGTSTWGDKIFELSRKEWDDNNWTLFQRHVQKMPCALDEQKPVIERSVPFAILTHSKTQYNSIIDLLEGEGFEDVSGCFSQESPYLHNYYEDNEEEFSDADKDWIYGAFSDAHSNLAIIDANDTDFDTIRQIVSTKNASPSGPLDKTADYHFLQFKRGSALYWTKDDIVNIPHHKQMKIHHLTNGNNYDGSMGNMDIIDVKSIDKSTLNKARDIWPELRRLMDADVPPPTMTAATRTGKYISSGPFPEGDITLTSQLWNSSVDLPSNNSNGTALPTQKQPIEKTNSSTNTNNNNSMKSIFGNLKVTFGILSNPKLVATMYGVGFKDNDTVHAYDRVNEQMMDVAGMTFDEFPVIGFPTTDPEVGDTLLINERLLLVEEVENGEIVGVDFGTQERVIKVKATNLFNWKIYTKVITPFDGAIAGSGNGAGGPFGNINPMMFMFMNGDNKEGGKTGGMGDMMQTMLMMQMMGGGQQGGIFGMNNPAPKTRSTKK